MDRQAKFEAEVRRLRGLRASLDVDRKRVRYMAILLPLAAPLGYVWGPLAASAVLLGTVALVATSVYLIEVRRREYAGEIELYERELDRLRHGP